MSPNFLFVLPNINTSTTIYFINFKIYIIVPHIVAF